MVEHGKISPWPFATSAFLRVKCEERVNKLDAVRKRQQPWRTHNGQQDRPWRQSLETQPIYEADVALRLPNAIALGLALP